MSASGEHGNLVWRDGEEEPKVCGVVTLALGAYFAKSSLVWLMSGA